MALECAGTENPGTDERMRSATETRTEKAQVRSYLYPLDHSELLGQLLHFPCEVHGPLQHDEGVDRREGCLDGRLTLDTQHLWDTEPNEDISLWGSV